MTGNYVLALRSILRNKFFSIINVFGLSLGMAISGLILFYVVFETSYDKFQPDAVDIFRVELHTYREGALESKSALTSPAVAYTLANNFPEVMTIVRIASNPGKVTIKLQDNIVQEGRVYIADSSICNLFRFEFIQGNSSNVLNGPYDVIISENLAKKLFGQNLNTTLLARTIDIHSDGITGTFNINGIFRDFPENSHLNPQLIVSKSYLKELVGNLADDNSWNFNFFHSYLKLKPGTNPESLRLSFNDYVSNDRREVLQSTNASFDFQFLPMTDIHLRSDVSFDMEEGGDLQVVYAFGTIAIVILVVAWINFINLATARGIRRAKEVGVRKVLGAARVQLMFQFLLEALLLNGFGLLLSLVLIEFAKPIFSSLIEIPAKFMTVAFLLSDTTHVLIAIGVFCSGVLLSGIYPAFILSSYNPIKALKSAVKPKGLTLRKGLIVIQIGISLVMITGTFAIYKQVTFMRSTDLGIDVAKVLVVEAPNILDDATKSATNVFKSAIEDLSFVKNFSMSSVVPGQEVTFRSYNLSNERTKVTINCGIIGVDLDFFKNFGVGLVAGEYFASADNLNSGVIINEEAARQLGFARPDQAVGARVVHDNKGRQTIYVVQGVVRNYHQRSLQSALEPIMFTNSKDIAYYSIKLKENSWSQLESKVEMIRRLYEKFFPNNVYTYFFLDQHFDRQYKSDIKFGTIFFSFSVLAIVISAVGILGLSTFMINLRIREVGIRKVMGADSWSITRLFMQEYFRMVFVSIFFGVPLSYYLMLHWLQDFAFKINVTLLMLVGPVLLLIMIIMGVVGLQSFNAARSNPIDAIGENQ